MKRNKYSIILTGIVISLMGCNDAKYDTVDSMVYIKESKTQAYIAQKVPIRSADLPVYFTPCAGQAVPEDVKVQVAINEAVLEAYNQRNGTDYVLLPQEGYDVENNTVTIKQGKLDAQGVKVTFKPMTEEMKKSGRNYALPVSIATEGSIKTLKGADMMIYIMDPLKTISVPVINRNNLLKMQMRQDYELKEWSVEFRISIDKLGKEIGKWNNQALFAAFAPAGKTGEIYTRFGDTTTEGNRLQAKNQDSQMNTNMLFNTDTWYHLAFVNDGTKLTIYVNGVKDSEKTMKGIVTNLGKNKSSFGNPDDRQYLVANVKVSELRFWTKAITPTQILNNMFNVNPESDGLEAYWRLDEGEGNEFRDYTGHGNLCTSESDTRWIKNIIADNKPDKDVENVE